MDKNLRQLQEDEHFVTFITYYPSMTERQRIFICTTRRVYKIEDDILVPLPVNKEE